MTMHGKCFFGFTLTAVLCFMAAKLTNVAPLTFSFFSGFSAWLAVVTLILGCLKVGKGSENAEG